MSYPGGRGKADYLALGDWNVVCFDCGRKFKASMMRRNWQGFYECPDHWTPRQPQDFVRSVPDKQTPPWVQPMPEDVFQGPTTYELDEVPSSTLAVGFTASSTNTGAVFFEFPSTTGEGGTYIPGQLVPMLPVSPAGTFIRGTTYVVRYVNQLIIIVLPDEDASDCVAATSVVPPDGISTTTITVTLLTATGELVSGIEMQITASSSAVTIVPSFATTDVNGQAEFTVSCASSVTASFTATDLPGTFIITQKAYITFGMTALWFQANSSEIWGMDFYGNVTETHATMGLLQCSTPGNVYLRSGVVYYQYTASNFVQGAALDPVVNTNYIVDTTNGVVASGDAATGDNVRYYGNYFNLISSATNGGVPHATQVRSGGTIYENDGVLQGRTLASNLDLTINQVFTNTTASRTNGVAGGLLAASDAKVFVAQSEAISSNVSIDVYSLAGAFVQTISNVYIPTTAGVYKIAGMIANTTTLLVWGTNGGDVFAVSVNLSTYTVTDCTNNLQLSPLFTNIAVGGGASHFRMACLVNKTF